MAFYSPNSKKLFFIHLFYCVTQNLSFLNFLFVCKVTPFTASESSRSSISTHSCLIPITIGLFFTSVKGVWAELKQSTRAPSTVDRAPRQTKTSADRCTGTFILLPVEHSYQRLRFNADLKKKKNHLFQSSSY